MTAKLNHLCEFVYRLMVALVFTVGVTIAAGVVLYLLAGFIGGPIWLTLWALSS